MSSPFRAVHWRRAAVMISDHFSNRSSCIATTYPPPFTNSAPSRIASKRWESAAAAVGQAWSLKQQRYTARRDVTRKGPERALAKRDFIGEINRMVHNARKEAGIERHFSPEFRRPFYFTDDEIQEHSCRGTGPGGQATNRRMQTAVVRHVPTGMIVRYHHWTSLYRNRLFARMILNMRLEQLLLGERSTLGLLQLRKRRLHHVRQRKKQRAARMRARFELNESRAAAQLQLPFVDCLTAAQPIPPRVWCSVSALLRASEQTSAEIVELVDRNAAAITVSVLHEQGPTAWWTMLVTCCSHPPATAGGEDASGLLFEGQLLWELLFPALGPRPLPRWQNQALVRGGFPGFDPSSPAIVGMAASVRRSFCILIEAFGWRWTDACTSGLVATQADRAERKSTHRKKRALAKLARGRLERDGLNWIEYRARINELCDGACAGAARQLFDRIRSSLRQVWLDDEAAALDEALQREADDVASPVARWCAAILAPTSGGVETAAAPPFKEEMII